MDNINGQESQQPQAPATPTENPKPTVPTEISSLARHREQLQRASSARAEQKETGGEPQPNVGQQEPSKPEREPYIPRDRFDEVLRQRDAFQQQLTQMQQMMQQAQQPQMGPTGMMQPPQQHLNPPQQQQQVQSFLDQVMKDPAAKQQWQKRIANEGITALAEFVTKTIEDRGRPLLEEYSRSINDRITPLQQSLLRQQISSYANQKASDPEFQVARPMFEQLVNTAVQRGYDVTNPQVLSTIEFLAKQQARQFAPPATPQQPMQQVAPFSERPGSSSQPFPKPAYRALTPQEQAMANRFNLTPQQYIDSLRAMGAE